jgi:putrescine transport system substrate-binding protein
LTVNQLVVGSIPTAGATNPFASLKFHEQMVVPQSFVPYTFCQSILGDVMKTSITVLTCTTLLAAGAQAETLNIYNWSDYIAEDTIAKFTEATGIEVVYDVYDSNEVLEAKMLAGSSGYDLVVPTSDFLQRQIEAGVYQPLDKSKLPNLVNMDAELMAGAAGYDADNAHSVIYMWGTTGIGYNIDMIAERLGADYEVNSWDLVFDPETVAKLADCGVSMLDAPTEVIPAALNYLGHNPNSEDKAELEAAAALLESIRPHIRYFHSSQYINDMANGDTCIAVGWSGDVFQARDRADEADNGVNLAYVVPKEGALQWFDMLAIPADAPNPDAAHKFINFIMEPQITADITNYVWYASANEAALPLIDEEITSDPGIFPTEDAKANLWPAEVKPPKIDRMITRLWTRVTTGQ